MKLVSEAIDLLVQEKEAALGTLLEGKPFVSHIGYGLQRENPEKIYLLLSDLAQHTKNIQTNPYASLLIVESRSDIQTHQKKRMTLLGKLLQISKSEEIGIAKKSYLKKFPYAEMFLSLPDFHFYEFCVEEVHWYGGFGKAATFR